MSVKRSTNCFPLWIWCDISRLSYLISFFWRKKSAGGDACGLSWLWNVSQVLCEASWWVFVLPLDGSINFDNSQDISNELHLQSQSDVTISLFIHYPHQVIQQIHFCVLFFCQSSKVFDIDPNSPSMHDSQIIHCGYLISLIRTLHQWCFLTGNPNRPQSKVVPSQE
jgi:hypothetical protein